MDKQVKKVHPSPNRRGFAVFRRHSINLLLLLLAPLATYAALTNEQPVLAAGCFSLVLVALVMTIIK